MICMMVMALTTFIWSIYYKGIDDYVLYYKLDAIGTTTGLLFFPFIYLYFRTLTDERPLSWREFISFLPSLIIGVASVIMYAYMGPEQAAAYMESIIMDYDEWDKFTDPVFRIHYVVNMMGYYITFMLQGLWVMRYTIFHLISYRKRLENFYSNPEVNSLKHVKAMLIGIFLLLIIAVVSGLEMFVLYYKYPIYVSISFCIWASLFYFINHQVRRINYTVESLKENMDQADGEAEESESRSIIRQDLKEEITGRLNQLLDEDEIFRKQDLRLDDLVHLTRTNRTYLSLLIKEEYQCNFSELINRRRIDYAQRLAKEKPNLSQIQISEDSGFVYPSSFSRTFKQYAGVTFREWLKCQ